MGCRGEEGGIRMENEGSDKITVGVVLVHCWFCTQTQLDSIGCELNCSTMTDHTQDHKFVIARNEVGQCGAQHTVRKIKMYLMH